MRDLLSEAFRATAGKELGPDCGSVNFTACPDQFAGRISTLEGALDFERIGVDEGKRTRQGPRLIMVLESPHKYEFKPGGASATPGPAKGPTGRNIRKHLATILGNAGIKDCLDMELVLMNAVQFQCSLGLRTDQVRDYVFLHMWNGGADADFFERASALYRGPDYGDVFLNACTKGRTATPLRDYVKDLISQVTSRFHTLGQAKHLRTNHPASWRRKEPPVASYEH